MRLTQWLEELRDDVKFALRQLRSSPAFTLVAAITLALGIGANSAIFALVDATLLRPLPFREPERLVMVWERSDTSPRSRVAPLNLLDWNERNRTFDLMAGFIPGVGGMVMNGADGTAETVPRQWVTAGFFDVLGVKAIAGRTFLPSDDSQRVQCRRAERSVLANAVRRGPDRGRPRHPAGWVAVYRGRRRAQGRFSCWAGAASGRWSPSRARRPPRERAYFLQVDRTLEARRDARGRGL